MRVSANIPTLAEFTTTVSHHVFQSILYCIDVGNFWTKKMTQKVTVLLVLSYFQTINAAVLLWSDQEIKISPLQLFSERDLTKLTENLERPDVHIFQSPSQLSSAFKEILNGYYSAYTPNGNIESENITYLLGDDDLDILKIKEVVSEYKSNNILFAINIPASERSKREVDVTSESNTTPKPSTGSVIYRGRNSNTQLYALLYSSGPLLLRRNETDDVFLGSTDDDMIIYDTRLNVNVIPQNGEGKITLRFSFTWVNGYWYMKSVKITDTNTNKDYNLTTEEEVMASAQFSYHCNGVTVFSDSGGTELVIQDLQVQPDSRNGKFDDANDCVPFTTVPIWSGLFITAILALGLIIALSAIMDIKTMDKFDNHKTKNLVITVSD